MVNLELIESPVSLSEKRHTQNMKKIRAVGELQAENMGVNHPANQKIFTDGYIQGLHDMVVIAARKGLRIQLEDLIHGG